MSTYAQMQAKIADDLNRSDLTTQISREINRAIRKYGSMPFWFSGTTQNFQSAKWQQSYDTNDGLPSDIRIINYVRVNQSTGTIYTTGGSANTYTLTPSPAASSYVDGDTYFVEVATSATNTGASTLNVSSLGAKDITRPNGDALQAGDLTAGQVYTVVYNDTADDFYLREASGTYYELIERGIDQIITWNVNDVPGLPLEYAWFDSKLYLYPTPDDKYVMQVYYQKYYADLSAGSDTNDFTTNPEAEQLIEEEAKFQIYQSIILDDERADRCRMMRDEALKLCRRVSNNLISVHGSIRATDF